MFLAFLHYFKHTCMLRTPLTRCVLQEKLENIISLLHDAIIRKSLLIKQKYFTYKNKENNTWSYFNKNFNNISTESDKK